MIDINEKMINEYANELITEIKNCEMSEMIEKIYRIKAIISLLRSDDRCDNRTVADDIDERLQATIERSNRENWRVAESKGKDAIKKWNEAQSFIKKQEER